MHAAETVRHNDEATAACAQEAKLFEHVEFESHTDKDRAKAALICSSCDLALQCPVRIIPEQRRRRPRKPKADAVVTVEAVAAAA